MPGIKSLILQEFVVSLGRQTPALIDQRQTDRLKSTITAWAQVADQLVVSWSAWAQCLWDCPSVKDVIMTWEVAVRWLPREGSRAPSRKSCLLVGVWVTHTSLPSCSPLLLLWLDLYYCCCWVGLCGDLLKIKRSCFSLLRLLMVSSPLSSSPDPCHEEEDLAFLVWV